MKIKARYVFPNWISSGLMIKLIVLAISFTIIGCSKEDDENLVNETPLCLVEIDGNFEDVELDVAPEYLNGGYDGFINAIIEVIRYPAEARENNIQGLCIIQYEITKLGTVENIVVIQNPGGGIGESAAETIETVTAGVSFSPGILHGNPVRVKKELELKYVLQ